MINHIPWQEKLEILNSKEQAQKHFDMCAIPTAQAIIDFISNWCYTYDPRKQGSRTVPFVLYPRQQELVEWLYARLRGEEEGVVEKSRDVGASWLSMAFSVYMIIFMPQISVGVYSMKADSVDVLGDTSSLLQKARMIIKYLPDAWTAGIESNYFHIKNKANGSDIVGSSGSNAGRGQRRTIFFADEFSFVEQADMVEAAISESSKAKIYLSTHSGTSSLFFRKVTSGAVPVFNFSWFDIPGHTRELYNEKRAKAEAEGTLHIFAREIDGDAAASAENVLIPSAWLSACKDEPKDGTSRIAALDVADEGGDVNCLVIREGNAIIFVEERGEGDTSEIADWAYWKARDFGCSELRYDKLGVGAGIKARVNEIEKHNKSDMRVVPYAASGEVARKNDQDYNETANKDFFANRKAQDYYYLRDLVLNTFRKHSEKDYDADKVISLPKGDIPEIAYNKMLRELSQPQAKIGVNGKMLIDKKPKGTKSPNIADAVMMCYAEMDTEWQSWSMV